MARRKQQNTVVYVCPDFYVRRTIDGFRVNYQNCYIATRPTLRLAKKVFRRRRTNREFAVIGDVC